MLIIKGKKSLKNCSFLPPFVNGFLIKVYAKKQSKPKIIGSFEKEKGESKTFIVNRSANIKCLPDLNRNSPRLIKKGL